MTLDEAIKHCEEVADFCEFEASRYDIADAYECHVACQEGICGEEHRQLAEWLKELKQLKEQTWSLDDAREDFMYDVYKTLESLPTNDEANRIIEVFDRVTSDIRCDDAISRQAVIDEIEFYQINPQHFDFVSLIGDIKALPPVTPTQKWIPVSERLPEVTETITDGDFDDWYTVYESSEVLVFGTCEGGREKHIYTANYNEWIHEDGRKECEWRDNLLGDIEINVIAWMPLPEPYKST